MSTAPSGWQDPKLAWQSSDVPLPTDFERIEGNAYAAELGGRTLDPAQVPSSNTGHLRQILDWLANRIRAITGAANWYDTPATTLSATKSHMDATSGIHGATSSATANRLVIRDASGRAKFAQGASTGEAVVYPVPVGSLKKAQGSANAAIFSVHQYAFGAPTHAARSDVALAIVTAAVNKSAGTTRQWATVFRQFGNDWSNTQSDTVNADADVRNTVTWDYLTASGHPRVWAEVDESGEIISMWEAEDPSDEDFPDEPPIDVSRDESGEPIPGQLVIPVHAPDEEILQAVLDRMPSAPRGQWMTRSRLAGLGPPDRMQQRLFEDQCRERGLDIPEDPRDALSISDYDRRHWYLQLWLRQASRLLHDHRSSTLIPLYRDMFRVDRRTGQLVLR